MKDVVDFETALRLKEAGFPQPSLEVGQFWYMEGFDMPRIAIVGSWTTADHRPVYRYIDANTWDFPDEKTAVFAPTATDILRELPGLDFELVYSEGNEDFAVHQTLDGDIINSWNDENPAELMAKPYLHLKNKK